MKTINKKKVGYIELDAITPDPLSDNQVWTDGDDLFVQLNGVTKQLNDQGGGGSSWTVVSSSQTATNDAQYIVVATATFTDPTPAEGKGFEVFVRNGTATVGGTAYSVAGTFIHRIFHSGAWVNYVQRGVVVSGTSNRLAYYSATGDSVSELGAITASRALVSDTNGLPTHSATTSTELGYVSGVTSAIQTQLDNLEKLFKIYIDLVNYDNSTLKAPVNMKINSVSEQSGSTTILVNASAYTLGNSISQYDSIKVTNAVGSLVTLNCEKI